MCDKLSLVEKQQKLKSVNSCHPLQARGILQFGNGLRFRKYATSVITHFMQMILYMEYFFYRNKYNLKIISYFFSLLSLHERGFKGCNHGFSTHLHRIYNKYYYS